MTNARSLSEVCPCSGASKSYFEPPLQSKISQLSKDMFRNLDVCPGSSSCEGSDEPGSDQSLAPCPAASQNESCSLDWSWNRHFIITCCLQCPDSAELIHVKKSQTNSSEISQLSKEMFRTLDIARHRMSVAKSVLARAVQNKHPNLDIDL